MKDNKLKMKSQHLELESPKLFGSQCSEFQYPPSVTKSKMMSPDDIPLRSRKSGTSQSTRNQ